MTSFKSLIPRFAITFAKRTVYKRRFAKMGLRTDYAEIVDPSIRTEICVRFLGPVSVGRNVSIGKYTYLTDGRVSSNVTIGRYCSIARGVNLAGTEHPIDWLTSSPVAYDTEYFPEANRLQKFALRDETKTVIGNDVWIGASSIIKRGVTIGDGAIVGAGSVVTKDVPPYAIAVGVPARVIRFRFDPIKIEELMSLRWWDMEDEDLMDIPWTDVDASISSLKKKRSAG